MAWAIISRAAASMHDSRAARAALHQAENLFPSNDTEQNTAFLFTTGQLHFYRSHTLTTIGENSAAWQAQDDALASFGPDERLDPILVHLDRAVCMVTDGDPARGSAYATTTLLNLPAEYRPAIIVRRAHDVAAAVPPQQRSAPAVRSLYEALAIETGR